MRAFLFSLPLLAITSIQITHATDVDYALISNNITELPAEKNAKPFSIQVKDRVWVYQGIEEGTEQAKVPVVAGSDTPHIRHIRLERSPEMTMRSSYSVDFSEPATQAPDWIDDGLWPRTKEILNYAKEPQPLPLVSETVLWLGPPCRGAY